MSRNAVVQALLLLLVSALGGQTTAKKVLVDRVVAVVEDQAVFASDVNQMVKQFMFQEGAEVTDSSVIAEMERKALEELVNNKLILVQAERLGMEVPFSDVEERVERTIAEYEKMLGGKEAFDHQLQAEGLTLEELKKLYREQIRNRMLMDRVLSSEIDRAKLQVSDEELRSEYQKRKANFPKRPEVVHLATIFFAFKSSSRATEEARKRIEEIRQKIQGGMDFSEAARIYSEDPSSERGGDLGFMNIDDIKEKTFAEAAARLQTGQMSEPVLTSYGYHLIRMVGKRESDGAVHLQHILVRVKPGDEDIRSVFERAQGVYEQLEAGAAFDSLAALYSDDESSAERGGDLGWLKVADLPSFFQDVLSEMEVGHTSQILRESSGFRIVKLLGREEEREYTFDEVKGELRKIIEQDKMSLMLDDYIRKLRGKFHVEIRD